jgi:hypothetical protein
MHAGQANHSSVVAMPGGKEKRIEFEELAGDGSVCRARRQPMGAWAVGGTTYVIAQASGRPGRDAWVEAVAAALARERGWRERRWTLTVRMGEEIMFHVTAASNRESIAAHGFDSQRMGTATGIAGSPQPELPGVFVCDSREAAQFFVDMARWPCDVWAIRADGLWVESGPVGWELLPVPVEAERVTLVERDVISLRLLRERADGQM